MSAQFAVVLPLAVSLLLGGTFVANEWSHGGIAEAAGIGHHHMLDWDGAHCHGHGDNGHPAAYAHDHQHAYEHGTAAGAYGHADDCPEAPASHAPFAHTDRGGSLG